MAINMDGTTYDSVDEFFEVMDGMYERGMMKIDDMPDPDKFREYLAEKKAEEETICEYSVPESDGKSIALKIGEDFVGAFAKKGEEDEPTIEAGDKVRIIGNRELLLAGDSVLHHFEIGDVGEVMSIDSGGDLNVKVSGSKCGTQFVSPEHVETVEPIAQDANGEDLYEGDLVTGIDDEEYFFTTSEALMRVVKIRGITSRIGVSVLNHVSEEFEGRTARVYPEYFVKTTEEEYHKTHNPKIEVGSKVIALVDGCGKTEGSVYEVEDVDVVGDYEIIDDDGDYSYFDRLASGITFRLATDEEVADAESNVTEPKFKVGDKVRVVNSDKEAGYFHDFDKGEEGRITAVEPDIRNSGETTPYKIETNGRTFTQNLADKDIELIADSRDFQSGDIVMVNETFMDITRDVAEEGLAEVFVGASGNMYVKQPHISGIGLKVSPSNEDKLTLVCRAEDRLDTEDF